MNKYLHTIMSVCLGISSAIAYGAQWLPGTITSYQWEREEWSAPTESAVMYDTFGNVVSKKTGDQSETFQYDPVVHDFVVREIIDYSFLILDFVTDIKRNDEGNIIKIRSHSADQDGEYNSSYAMDISYVNNAADAISV